MVCRGAVAEWGAVPILRFGQRTRAAYPQAPALSVPDVPQGFQRQNPDADA